MGNDISIPYAVKSVVFSPKGELIIDTFEDNRRFYNFTKGEFILNDKLSFNVVSYELTDITDSGDFLLKKQTWAPLSDRTPEYVLINPSDGFIKQSWGSRYFAYKSQFDFLSSLRFVNRNDIKVGYVNNRFSIIGQSPSPHSFIYDFKEMDDFTFHNGLTFYFFKDKNTIGVTNGKNIGVIDRQTKRWNKIDDLPAEAYNYGFIWFEKTDKYLYVGFGEEGSRTESTLYIKNLEENKTVQCEVYERIQ